MSFFDVELEAIVQGNTLRYYRKGKGEIVVFIHGITTYSFIWSGIAEPISEKYDTIAIDLLACGDSGKPLREDVSLKRQAHLIKDLCDQLNISKIHLVCHDVGGGVGQIFAVNYPEMLSSLTLINSVAYNFWPVQPIISIRTPIIRQITMAALDLGMFEIIVKRGLYHKDRLDKELLDKFFKPLKTSIGRKAFLHFAKSLDNKNLTEIEKEIAEIPVPVNIIRGDADVYLSAAISDKLHSEIKTSKLEIIKTGGHFIQIDEPELITNSILDFIS